VGKGFGILPWYRNGVKKVIRGVTTSCPTIGIEMSYFSGHAIA